MSAEFAEAICSVINLNAMAVQELHLIYLNLPFVCLNFMQRHCEFNLYAKACQCIGIGLIPDFMRRHAAEADLGNEHELRW